MLLSHIPEKKMGIMSCFMLQEPNLSRYSWRREAAKQSSAAQEGLSIIAVKSIGDTIQVLENRQNTHVWYHLDVYYPDTQVNRSQYIFLSVVPSFTQTCPVKLTPVFLKGTSNSPQGTGRLATLGDSMGLVLNLHRHMMLEPF